jgi:hypothetical protein
MDEVDNGSGELLAAAYPPSARAPLNSAIRLDRPLAVFRSTPFDLLVQWRGGVVVDESTWLRHDDA